MTSEIFFKNICEACDDINAQIPLPVIDRCCCEIFHVLNEEDINILTYAGYKAIAEQIQSSYDAEMATHFIELIKE